MRKGWRKTRKLLGTNKPADGQTLITSSILKKTCGNKYSVHLIGKTVFLISYITFNLTKYTFYVIKRLKHTQLQSINLRTKILYGENYKNSYLHIFLHGWTSNLSNDDINPKETLNHWLGMKLSLANKFSWPYFI